MLAVLSVLLLAGAAWMFHRSDRLDADPRESAIRLAMSELELIRTALDAFHKSAGRYPSSEEGLEILHSTSSGGPYLRDTMRFVDPWGQPYRYKTEANGYSLYSDGPNRRDEQGKGDDVR